MWDTAHWYIRLMNKYDQMFKVVCPKCSGERELRYKAYWYVSKHPDTTCKTCRPVTTEHLKGRPPWNKGLVGFMKGHPPYFVAKGESNPFFGKTHTDETKEKMRQKKLGMVGDRANRWAGDSVGYYGLHSWVNRELGKALGCSNNPNHISSRYHWANKSGEYRRDVTDWLSLCPSCHKKDGVKVPDRLKVR
jgi:hypothetical protein